MWYSRNDELHSNEQSQINKAKSSKYNAKIENIFERKRDIPSGVLAPGDRQYFRRRQQAIERMRNKEKDRWIRDTELILNKYDNKNETEQVQQFRAYFMHRDDG